MTDVNGQRILPSSIAINGQRGVEARLRDGPLRMSVIQRWWGARSTNFNVDARISGVAVKLRLDAG